MSTLLSAALYSTFNVGQFARLLANDTAAPPLRLADVHSLQFGGSFSSGSLPASDADVAVVVTTPESVLPSIASLLSGFRCDLDVLRRDVDAFAEGIAGLSSRLVIVPSWIAPNRYSGGLLALDDGYGLDAAVAVANARLVETLRSHRTRRVLSAGAWQRTLGERAISAKNWYLTKDPYSFEFWKLAVADIKSALLALLGRAKKLIVLDLDNTLWGGEVGDAGVEGLRLGGHDPAGEAYQAFQRELLALARRGVLLAVASKNDEALALSAIDRHPEMLIRREHLAGWVIDWEGKAANVRALCRRVGIALQDAVLIDDNPVERAAARAALPELTVPEWPANPMLYVNALRGLSIFDVPDITDEDLARARTYVAARTVHESPAAIETRIEVSKARPDDMVRVLQLLNKTNQVNLATRRFADGELTAWLAGGRRDLWTFRLADRFADYGIVGVLSLEFRGGACTIVDFVMSCRVMSRGVEERMLQTARQEARANGCDIIEAQFVPTERNEPMRRFLTERSGLATQDGSHFFTTAGEPLQTTA